MMQKKQFDNYLESKKTLQQDRGDIPGVFEAGNGVLRGVFFEVKDQPPLIPSGLGGDFN